MRAAFFNALFHRKRFFSYKPSPKGKMSALPTEETFYHIQKSKIIIFALIKFIVKFSVCKHDFNARYFPER